mgnify:CR=1 FL=1
MGKQGLAVAGGSARVEVALDDQRQAAAHDAVAVAPVTRHASTVVAKDKARGIVRAPRTFSNSFACARRPHLRTNTGEGE